MCDCCGNSKGSAGESADKGCRGSGYHVGTCRSMQCVRDKAGRRVWSSECAICEHLRCSNNACVDAKLLGSTRSTEISFDCRYTRMFTCSGPKPESYPRTYPNPRISEDDPGPDPLDPGDHRPGPRYPRGTPGGPRRGLHAVPDPESAPLCPKRPIAAGLAARAVTGGRLAAPPYGR